VVPHEQNGNERTNGVDASQYAAARAHRETFLAKTAQLQYEQAMGKLLEANAVHDAAFRSARTARDLLLGLPARLAPQVCATQDQGTCHAILEKAVREICELISRSAEPAAIRKAKGRAQ
jgi:hypothetical protein